MSIKPPSDIVMDVALAADPAKRDAAMRRLANVSASDAGPSFTAALATTRAISDASVRPPSSSTAPAVRKADASGGMAGAMSALETLFLRNAFDTMLPASRHAAGFASAGAGVWKSMLADALANQVAASGGLHILARRDAA